MNNMTASVPRTSLSPGDTEGPQAGADPWSSVLREFADYCEGYGFETVNTASIRAHADMLDNAAR